MRTLKQRLARPASRAVLGGFRPPEDPFVSWFGAVKVAGLSETWPTNGHAPMLPLCQFNLAEAPYRPDALADIALLTVFLDPDRLGSIGPNGEGWLLRAYSSLHALAPLQQAAGVRWPIKPMPIRWEEIKADYPCWDDAVRIEATGKTEMDDWDERFPNVDATKLGGWPTLVQGEICWAPGDQHPAHPEYVFQIGEEEKARWSWGDLGVGYFGRGIGSHSHEWAFEWQCT